MNSITKQHGEIRGTRVGILGYGREGKSVLRWLQQHKPDGQYTILDASTLPSLADEGVSVRSGDGYLDDLASFDTLVRSPGVSVYEPHLSAYIRSGGHVTSATNIFFSLVSGTTVGITGTKGKSTTSALIAHILSQVKNDVRLVGNIGLPMLDALDTSTSQTVFVIELSSHQLVDIHYSPRVAVLLSIVPEHLDYYPDFQTYVEAKRGICAYQSKDDVLIYDDTSALASNIASHAAAKTMAIQNDFTVSDAPLLGNMRNILAARMVSAYFDVSDEQIRRSIQTFVPLPHRLTVVGDYRAIRFINDSLSTIPEATIHALTSVNNVKTLIAGGYDRHISFTELGKEIVARRVGTLILFPDTGRAIWEAVCEAGGEAQGIRHKEVESMEEAVCTAYDMTPPGSVCLLSPASASYNMFRDYQDRGEQFSYWVQRLGEGSS